MKVLVVYHSVSGNTEVLAQAIYHAVTNVTDKTILPLDEASGAGAYDLVFVGFPVMSHSVPPRAARFIQDLPEGAKLALFSTHGSFRGGELAVTAFFHALGLAKGKTVLGTYGCQGEVSDQVIDGLRGKPEHGGWLLEAKGAMGHPDDADRADAREFTRLMLAKARVG